MVIPTWVSYKRWRSTELFVQLKGLHLAAALSTVIEAMHGRHESNEEGFFRFIRQKVTSGSPDWYLVTAELIRVESTYWFCPTYCAQSVDGPPFVGIR